ncbi:ATP-binding cassette domain-containing protein [Streptomyces sp. NPDC049837]|uniref:ATP-binding cassette domain-containing protein n=1 Tax=Streptomyces sp. NPDC049837 TaxID=3155277 RepID=UPI0034415C98
MTITDPAGLAVETSGLVKVFGDNRAVDGIDLRVPAGTVYGVLGPNGAGKTTAVKVLATLLRPDGGEARVFGKDVVRDADAVRGRVSLTGQYASVDEDLTGTENLVLLGRLLGHGKRAARERCAQLLEAFGLSEAAGRQVKNYSGGMRRRIDIAASILNTPDLLFLDEPTTGLDPRSRNQVWEIVRAVVARGTTVLLTTQYLDEADRLASRIAVIDRGRVIAEGTKGELKASVGSGSVHVRLREPGQRPEAERVLRAALNATVQLDHDPVALTATVDGHGTELGAAEQAARALTELARAGVTVDNFALGQPSLDEVFLALTDRGDDAEETRA